MFNEEEDWSDEPDSQSLPQIVCNDSEETNSKNVKLVGKKSLLRTLQTLGSVPEWKNEDHQQDSDSDNETQSAPSSTKRKKKRRKKRRHAKTPEEQQENGDMDQSTKEEKPAKKQKDHRLGAKKMKTTSAGETKEKAITNPTKTNIDKPGDAERLNRQQWKNKMKNKRKCQNKYRQNQAAGEEKKAESADKLEPKEVEKKESKTDSCSNKNSKKSSETADRKKKRETESKLQKRKQTEEATDISCASHKQTETNKTKGRNDNPVITVDQQEVPEKKPRPELSKEQSLKREQLRKMLQNKETEQREVPAEPSVEPPAPAVELKLDRSASLRARMEQRLESARFRYINEVLYSTTSGEAKRMFKQDPQAFWVYHRGYTAQVQRWPTNPLDAIISYIQQKSPSLVVADFGCGDCKIARSVKNKVHSFDLAATCELVTVCDMANVPLRDGSVDIAVFCLSLMGTNLADFLAEANRVLKMGGVLKIAEVASRFENVRSFINALSNLGFKMVVKDTENTHFYSFEYVKTGNAPENVKKFGLQLKPCLYKKR